MDTGDLQMSKLQKKYVTRQPDRQFYKPEIHLYTSIYLFIHLFISFNYSLLLYNIHITQKKANYFSMKFI